MTASTLNMNSPSFSPEKRLFMRVPEPIATKCNDSYGFTGWAQPHVMHRRDSGGQSWQMLVFAACALAAARKKSRYATVSFFSVCIAMGCLRGQNQELIDPPLPFEADFMTFS
jgi:hypothetical protein